MHRKVQLSGTREITSCVFLAETLQHTAESFFHSMEISKTIVQLLSWLSHVWNIKPNHYDQYVEQIICGSEHLNLQH